MIPLLLSISALVFVLYFVILYWYVLRLVKHDDDVPVAELCTVEHLLQTGDIILFRHKKYNAPMSWANRIMSHMAVLWRHPTEGMCIVDMNPEVNGPYGDVLPFTEVLRGTKTLVYRLRDSLRTYPGEVFVRRLKKPPTPEQELCFGTLLTQWAIDFEYVDSIAQRSLLSYAAFFLGIMTKPLAFAVVGLSELADARTSSFCSEMIGHLISRCGIVDLQDVPLHFSGPINWLYGLGESPSQFQWGEEIQLID